MTAINIGASSTSEFTHRANVAISAAEIRALLKDSAGDYGALNMAPRNGDDMDDNSLRGLGESGVYQLAIVARVPRLSWTQRIADVRGIKTLTGWNAYEDHWCNQCNGVGTIKCPGRGCVNGSRRVQETKLKARDPVTGREFYAPEWVTIKCDVCNGNGSITCPQGAACGLRVAANGVEASEEIFRGRKRRRREAGENKEPRMAISSEVQGRIAAMARQLCEEAPEVDESQGVCWLDAIENQAIEIADARNGGSRETTVLRSARSPGRGLSDVRPAGALSRSPPAGTRHPPRTDEDRRTGVLLPRLPPGFFSR